MPVRPVGGEHEHLRRPELVDDLRELRRVRRPVDRLQADPHVLADVGRRRPRQPRHLAPQAAPALVGAPQERGQPREPGLQQRDAQAGVAVEGPLGDEAQELGLERRGHVDVLLDPGRRPARRGRRQPRRAAEVQLGDEVVLRDRVEAAATSRGCRTASPSGPAGARRRTPDARRAGAPRPPPSPAGRWGRRAPPAAAGRGPATRRRASRSPPTRAPRRRRGCGSSRRRSRRSGSPVSIPSGSSTCACSERSVVPGAAPSTGGKSPSDVARFGGWAWSVGPENCVVESTSRQWSSRCGSRTEVSGTTAWTSQSITGRGAARSGRRGCPRGRACRGSGTTPTRRSRPPTGPARRARRSRRRASRPRRRTSRCRAGWPRP